MIPVQLHICRLDHGNNTVATTDQYAALSSQDNGGEEGSEEGIRHFRGHGAVWAWGGRGGGRHCATRAGRILSGICGLVDVAHDPRVMKHHVRAVDLLRTGHPHAVIAHSRSAGIVAVCAAVKAFAQKGLLCAVLPRKAKITA